MAATDNAFNTGSDTSNAAFTIVAPPGGVVPTTLRDFDQPGSQPFEAGTLNDPAACAVCHGGYNPSVEPYSNWQGSMMAQASLDPLFEACMAVANQDAPDSGDLCLRCHIPRAGCAAARCRPTARQMLATDKSGVSCDFCHRLVDPIYDPGVNPVEDQAILAALCSCPGSTSATGMFVIDPTGARRGPFIDATSGHPVLVSPFHREAALCGTCHDVSNPAFEKDGNGNYVPNAFDAPATNFSLDAPDADRADVQRVVQQRVQLAGRRLCPGVRRQQGVRGDLPGLPHARRDRARRATDPAAPVRTRSAAARHDRRQHVAARAAERACTRARSNAAAMQAGVARRRVHAAERGQPGGRAGGAGS